MSGFTSRKDPLSMKLRAQNMNSSTKTTKQLESESRKMEERLKELKIAMSREKEERERQGGTFWRSGKEGSLNKYSENVLKAKGEKKPRKIKVLKGDEEEEKTQRNKQPGTMAFIAQKDPSGKKSNKIKGPKCGQCEQKGANVTCLDCGEDYCARCFAAFHLKGALKKHRSAPCQTWERFPCPDRHGGDQVNGPPSVRRSFSPQPPPPAEGELRSSISKMHRLSSENYLEQQPVSMATQNGKRASPVGSSRPFDGPSLLDGEFDQEAGEQSFQQALKAWRQGPGEEESEKENQRESERGTTVGKTSSGVGNGRAYSPVQTPTVGIEEGTMAEENFGKKLLNITFQNHNVSYAEKLMLKRHRRTELTELPSPRLETHVTTMEDWKQRQMLRNSINGEGDEDTMVDDGERVQFQSLFQTVVTAAKPSLRSESSLSILELQETDHDHGLEQSASYLVSESQDDPGHDIKLAFVKSSPSENGSSKGQGLKTTKSSIDSEKGNSEIRRKVTSGKAGEGRLQGERSRSQQGQQNGESSAERKNSVKSGSKNEGKLSSAKSNSSVRSHGDMKMETGEPAVKSKQAKKEARPKSRSGSRAQSRSRPLSRAESRAALRDTFGEGVLTKAPTDALREIASARLVDPSKDCYTGGIGQFLLAGVQPPRDGEEGKVIIPTKHKTDARETSAKTKVSNKLYQMAPKSWRPDSSLAETVLDSQVANYDFSQSGKVLNSAHGQPDTETISYRRPSSRLVTPIPISPRPNSQMSSARPESRVIIVNPHRVRPVGAGPPTPSPRPNTGRQSSAIVVEGGDMSEFDFSDQKLLNSAEDDETLDNLEWELASETGRLTADGQISRMELVAGDEYAELGITEDDGRGTGLSSPDQDVDIFNRLRESDLMDDFEEMERVMMEEEVQALS